MKRLLLIASKAVVSVSILAVIASRVSPEEVLATMASGRPALLVAALAIAMLAIVLVAVRWRVVAGWLGLAISPALAIRALFVGVFGGQVLPSALGTDAVRGWLVARHTATVPRVLASLVADRLYALFGACLVLTFSAAIAGTPTSYPVQLVPLVTLVSGTALAAFLLWCCGKLKPGAWLKVPARLRSLSAPGGVRFRARPTVLALGLAISVQGAVVLVFGLTARAYGIDAPLELWFSIVPLSVIASAVPISINGWGVREATIVALAGPAGIPVSQAMLVSVTVGLLNIAASLPGAVFMLGGRDS